MNKLTNKRIYSTLMKVAKKAPEEIQRVGGRKWPEDATDLDKYTGGYENGVFDITTALVNAGILTDDQWHEILNALDGE